MKKSIYSYTDYREYLRDYYAHGKAEGDSFSYRSMAVSMGFTSPNYLKLIMDGDRHVGTNSIEKIASGLHLKKLESEYFSYLVFFAKAKTSVDQNYYYGQIARMRSGKNVATIDDTQLAYYEQWYTPVIREIIVNEKVNDVNPVEIARKLPSKVHYKQVAHSIQLLVDLGFLTIDENERYKQTSTLLNSANEVSSLAVKSFHKKMIDLGAESIDTVVREKREISSVTMKVSQDGFNNIKKRVQEFREEILQMLDDDTDVDQVAQLNFQLFPLITEDGENNE